MGSIPIGISASRGAAILGQSKYSEPVEAWLKICEDITPGFCEANLYPKPEFVDNAATRWGNALEDKICEFAVNETDSIDIVDREKLSAHPDYEYITCHQDGEYIIPRHSSSPRTIHEGKTANERTYRAEWGTPGTDQIPRGYMLQVQHQMMLTGAKRCIVSVLVLPKMQEELPDNDTISKSQLNMIADGLYLIGYFHQYPVERNDRLIKIMLKKYVDFWENNVLKKIPPKPESFEWVRKMIPTPCGTVIASEQVERWSTELKNWQDEKKHADAEIKKLKKYILEYMRQETQHENIVDEDSKKRIRLVAPNGYRMHSFNGKNFR